MNRPQGRTRGRRAVFLSLLAAGLLGWLLLLIGSATSPAVWAAAGSTPDSLSPSDPPSSQADRDRALRRLGVKAWHDAGQRGRGVKVAVLDTGFCAYRAHLGKALPREVSARSFRRDGNLEARDSQHGILCGEVVHALAPEAELLFADWEPDQPESFLQAVRWAREQGARVLSCSVVMPSWSDGEGHGAAHEELRRLLGDPDGAGGLLCFASAGNTAQRHWAGVFHDGGDGRHEWVKGEVENVVRPWGGDRVSVEAYWSSPARYELTVKDVTSAEAVGERLETSAPGCSSAAVRFNPRSGHAYTVEVRLAQGQPGRFHLAVLGGGLGRAVKGGSVCFPADGPEVVAVGAVTEEGRRLGYSSCGPNSERPKPDLAATVPFSSGWRERPFSGTSAAAPQAAGLAALEWGRHPDWTAARLREELRRAAVDLGPAGHDFETGYGRIRLP
jgi:subtilisin family serine protease